MSRSSGWTWMRSTALAFGLAAAVTAGARADIIPTTTITPDLGSTVLGYDTANSSIDTTKGVTTTGGADATSALKITSVAGGTFLTPSFLSLGAFQAASLGSGQSVTYNNTPFDFSFKADSLNGANGLAPNETPVNLSGVLNGTLTGNSQSSLTAQFGKWVTDSAGKSVFQPYTPQDTFKFNTGLSSGILYANTLTLPNNPVAIVPYTTNNGLTTAQAFLSSNSIGSPVPEPSTIVLFAATAVGLGFRHRLRKGRSGR